MHKIIKFCHFHQIQNAKQIVSMLVAGCLLIVCNLSMTAGCQHALQGRSWWCSVNDDSKAKLSLCKRLTLLSSAVEGRLALACQPCQTLVPPTFDRRRPFHILFNDSTRYLGATDVCDNTPLKLSYYDKPPPRNDSRGEVFWFDKGKDSKNCVYIEWSGPWRHHCRTNLFLTCNTEDHRLELRYPNPHQDVADDPMFLFSVEDGKSEHLKVLRWQADPHSVYYPAAKRDDRRIFLQTTINDDCQIYISGVEERCWPH